MRAFKLYDFGIALVIILFMAFSFFVGSEYRSWKDCMNKAIYGKSHMTHEEATTHCKKK